MNAASLHSAPTKRQAIRAAAQAAILLYRAGLKDQANQVWSVALSTLRAEA